MAFHLIGRTVNLNSCACVSSGRQEMACAPFEGMTEAQISESLAAMSIEAACLNFLAKGEFGAVLEASGEVRWYVASEGAP